MRNQLAVCAGRKRVMAYVPYGLLLLLLFILLLLTGIKCTCTQTPRLLPLLTALLLLNKHVLLISQWARYTKTFKVSKVTSRR